MEPIIGRPVDRVDGRAKVTGRATYSAEWDLPGLVYGRLVTSPIATGRITAIDTRAALAAPGVLAVLTHLNAPFAWLGDKALQAASALHLVELCPDPLLALQDDVVRYSGQPVAVVVAETFQQAMHAASLVHVTYAHGTAPRTDLDTRHNEGYKPHSANGEPPDAARGDWQAAWRDAEVRHEATYLTPAESHSPMEPHATVAHWKNDNVTVYDATQYVYGVKTLISVLFGVLPSQVRVVSKFVGGAFGSKGIPWPHVPLAVMAARHVGRPVKLVLHRREMFGLVGFRPRTHQTLRLGARRDGTLTVLTHDGVSQTSSFGEFVEAVGALSKILYACPNVAVTHRVVRLDTQTPTFQRAPGEAPGSFALESAIDELAHKLEMDPLALRIKNYAQRDPDNGLPWSSKELQACYAQGAERFGWESRPLLPGTLREGRLLVGQGMATSSFPCNRSGAMAHVQLNADGTAVARSATHDLGTGTYTVMTQVTAEALGLPLTSVRFELGDTDYPYAPVAGGSQSAASVSNVVYTAAFDVRKQLIALAVKDPASPLHGLDPARVGAAEGRLYDLEAPARGESHAAILGRRGDRPLQAEHETKPGESASKFSSHAWGAQFAEVQVDPDTYTVRVTRLVGAFAGGRILNQKTARSQLVGGMVMGLGMALLEDVVRDPVQGRVVTGSLADYLVPVHADIPAIDAFFVPEEDPHVNPLGVKGLGELGIVGTAAAIANAVFHATGKRVRELPITIEKLV